MKMNDDPLDAMILVGGKGSRLRGVVNDRPKPMATVAGRPFLQWLLLALRKEGLRRVILCTGYMSESVENYFGDGALWDMELVYSRDPRPLGTAGAVRRALNHVCSNRLLVLNGDSYCRVDVNRLEQEHATRGARATLWLVPQDDCSRYGSVLVGADGRVRAFCEKSAKHTPGLISAGVYVLEREIAETIPTDRTVSLELEVFPKLVGNGLHAVVGGEGPFLDIGTPEAYALADAFVAREMVA